MSAEFTRNPNLEIRARFSQPPPSPEDPFVDARPPWFWTGAVPLPDACPGVRDDGTITAVAPPNLAHLERQKVLDYFINGWALTEVLFSALQGRSAFLLPPYHRLRHPLIFYYGHPAVLYVNKLRLAGLISGPQRRDFEKLFETGVDEMSWDDLSRAEVDWPAVEDVTAYRREVFGMVRTVIETHSDLEGGAITHDSPLWALFMAMEHERIHLETSSVLIREMPVELVRRPREWPRDGWSRALERVSETPVRGDTHPGNPLLPVPSTRVTIGKPHDWPSYGWDNEYGQRVVDVRPFAASWTLISNGEFHAFVCAHGYGERRYWTDEGWRWRTYRNAKWPTFWVADGPAGLHQYLLRTIFEIVPMRWDWPVEVNRHEALAYCAWRGEQDGRRVRLLTEAEHHALRPAPGRTASGHCPEAERGYALALSTGSPCSVDASVPGPHRHHDVFGNVWSWLEDDFHPLDEFRAHPLYDDFSTPCFDGKHSMIIGGSFVSIGDEASWFARFHFRPHFFQHCGFRIVVPEEPYVSDAVHLARDAGARIYETEDLLAQYLLLHYGAVEATMPYEMGPREATAFPKRCAQLTIEIASRLGIESARALDLGCAVGGATFELAREFSEVVGVDLSASFIAACETLRSDGVLPFDAPREGALRDSLLACVDPAIPRTRASFVRADACSLPPELEGFDAVLIANLLCRVPNPRAILSRLSGPRGLVRPGGIVVITSPYSWSEQFTPRRAWLGGFADGAHSVNSFDGLAAILGEAFELVEQRQMPLVIREHARKFQYIVAHGTAWRRRGPR